MQEHAPQNTKKVNAFSANSALSHKKPILENHLTISQTSPQSMFITEKSNTVKKSSQKYLYDTQENRKEKTESLMLFQGFICAVFIAAVLLLKFSNVDFYYQLKTSYEHFITSGINFSEQTPILRFIDEGVKAMQNIASDIGHMALTGTTQQETAQEAQEQELQLQQESQMQEHLTQENETQEPQVQTHESTQNSNSQITPWAVQNEAQAQSTSEHSSSQNNAQAQSSYEENEFTGMGGKTPSTDDSNIPYNVSLETYSQSVELIQPTYGVLTSEFGFRTNPISKQWEFHLGIDIAGEKGSDIFSAANGFVVECDTNSIRGNYVIIHHTSGLQTLYQHLDYTFVRAGEHVTSGERIATMGSTGYSTGPHLHFELIENGKYVNPLSEFEALQNTN